MAGPLVVAVCTEFTSLILLRFVEERARGLEPRAAMDVTARRTGRAFMVSGMTAIAGVAVLGTSSFPLLRDFGIIVALNVTVALVSALVVLPPILVWADERGWVSRSLIRRREKTHPELVGTAELRPEPQPVPGNGPEPQPEPQPEPVAHQEPQPVPGNGPEPQPEPVAHQEPQPVPGRVDLWRTPITQMGDGLPT